MEAGSKISILTLPSLVRCIKEADVVYTQIRFGSVETWVKLSKKEALTFVNDLISSYENPSDATPEDFDMFGNTFGTVELDAITMEKVLYLG